MKFISLFASEFSNFKIVDNLGNSSTFQGILMAIDKCTHDPRLGGDYKRLEKDGIMKHSYSYFTQGTGLFKDGVNIYLNLSRYEYSERGASRFVLSGMGDNNHYACWIIEFRIPASEISKYSDFKLMPKNK